MSGMKLLGREGEEICNIQSEKLNIQPETEKLHKRNVFFWRWVRFFFFSKYFSQEYFFEIFSKLKWMENIDSLYPN